MTVLLGHSPMSLQTDGLSLAVGDLIDVFPMRGLSLVLATSLPSPRRGMAARPVAQGVRYRVSPGMPWSVHPVELRVLLPQLPVEWDKLLEANSSRGEPMRVKALLSE